MTSFVYDEVFFHVTYERSCHVDYYYSSGHIIIVPEYY